MSTTIWDTNAGMIGYTLTYDASRPDAYGSQVNITFHLRTYIYSGSYFGYKIYWNSMWCNGTNWYNGLIKDNSPRQFDFWTDCSCTVYTNNDWIGGVRLIMDSPDNDGASGKYDSGSDINISVPAISKYWNDVNVYNPSGVQDYKSGYFDLYTSEDNSWRYNLTNEDSNMTHLRGSYFQVQNIRPYYSYYELDRVTGYDSIPSSGAYRKTFDGASEVMGIYMRYKTYTVTLDSQGATSSGSTSVKIQYATTTGNYPSITLPTKTGYEFGGYYTGTNGTGTQYYNANGNSVRNFEIAGDTTFYAYWIQNNTTIRAKVNGTIKEGVGYFKHNGEWKTISKVYLKTNNEWKVMN